MLSHPLLCSIIYICKLICSTILMRKIRMRKLSFLILPKKNAKFDNKSRKLKKMKKNEVYVKYKNLCLKLNKYFNNVWNTFNEVYLSGPWITFIYSSQILRIWGIQESLKTISCKKNQFVTIYFRKMAPWDGLGSPTSISKSSFGITLCFQLQHYTS